MSSKALVLDLVNAKNPLPKPLNLDLANVMGVVLDPERVSQVTTTVVPMPSTYYESPVEVEYDRVNLTEMFRARNDLHEWESLVPHLVGPYASDIHKMIDWISGELGLPLSVDDIVNRDYSWLREYEETNIPLEAKSDSLLYYGQATIRYTRSRLNLLDVIRLTDVAAIRKPYVTIEGRETNKASVTAATWCVDFTEYYDIIRKHDQADRPGNGGALANLMRDLFGFVSWPVDSSQRTVDYPTDVIPDSNPDYDRVVIQYFVDRSSQKTRPYEGPAYFHYNIMDLDTQ